MARLPTGLYEQLVNELIASQLEALDDAVHIDREPLHPSDAADRIALYVSGIVQETLADVSDARRREVAGRLSTKILQDVMETTETASLADRNLVQPLEVLRGIYRSNPDGSPARPEQPRTSLLDTTLMTNAPGEPGVGHQLRSEIASASRIDIVMAFIRRTGIAPFLDALQAHCDAGKPLRILTTTYTGSTEASALEELIERGAEIRVSYDVQSTRLHAKAWLFHRDTGISTAYVGSSNLTHAAQVTGLEWNVRLSEVRNAPVIDKVNAVFESYWHAQEFEPYDAETFALHHAHSSSHRVIPPLRPGLRPLPFQDRLLERIALERSRGRHRNLLVSATGTGKTVMAALDYARLRGSLPRARLLFVAHRKEILEQARDTFRAVLSDGAFGDLWVAGERPSRFEHVFASIQSLTAAGLSFLEPEHFDVVIIDEFHHAAARTYESLLQHLNPRELLGMTATPERSDGAPILTWFENRIAAELRLWDAIDQHRLVPFSYYGVHDGTDLRDIPWKRGRGYEIDELNRLYTGNDVWANLVLTHVRNKGPDYGSLKALGFCVSVEHAKFMAHVFRRADVPAMAVSATTPPNERQQALRDLEQGALKVVFAVDLFNEGVDIPSVNTLLMLRPTDSALLFQQQLGRGLRRHEGKSICTVLDFVGQHRNEHRADRRLGALLQGTRLEIGEQIKEGFPYLPAGCHMELDPVARDLILRNLKQSVPSRFSERVDELRGLAQRTGKDVSLADFLRHTGIEVEELYRGDRGWSDLRQEAGLPVEPSGPDERLLRRAVGRLLHVDDPERIDAYQGIAKSARIRTSFDQVALDARSLRVTRMLIGSLFDQIVDSKEPLRTSYQRLQDHPQVLNELMELLHVLREATSHLTTSLQDRPNVPLAIHGRYTRVEILAAFGHGDPELTKVANWQSGVMWLEPEKADLLTITMDKTHDAFRPTMKYRDYAIDRHHVHWESQSATREDSKTGLRYQQHEARGSDVFLFARHHRGERAYYLLGGARYLKHVGERPMAVTWQLDNPLPGDLFTSLAAAVA